MALTDNLVHYWKLDESSGNASDSVGSKTLTNNNSVGYVAAKINNGADGGSTPADKYLDATAPAFLAGYNNGAMSVSLWVSFNAQPASGQYWGFFQMCKATNTNASDSWIGLDYRNPSGTKQLFCWAVQANGNQTLTQTFTTGAWYHLVFTVDANKYTHIYINNVETTSASPMTNGGNYGSVKDFIELLRFQNSTSYDAPAIVDEVGIWSRGLTDAEVTSLYNGGSGLTYPFSASVSGGPGNMFAPWSAIQPSRK